MAQAFTSYIVDNDRSFRAALKRAASVTQDLRVPFGRILSDFYKSQQAIFQLKGPGKYPDFKKPTGFQPIAFGGKRSKGRPDKTAYQLRKLKKYGHDYPLLVATGALSSSLLGPNNEGSISEVTPLSLVVGTSIPYGVYHQSDDPRRKIPLRKFLFIGPEAPRFATSEQQGRLSRWNNILNDYVLKKMRQQIGA